MENPFEEIFKQLVLINNQLKQLLEVKVPKKQIVHMDEFLKHSGYAKQTLYQKLNRGEVIPGAFKIPGSKCWRFNLSTWDQHLQEAQDNQYKEKALQNEKN